MPIGLTFGVRNRFWRSCGPVFAIGSLLAACALPAAAPTALQLEASVNQADFPFHMVRVNSRVVSVLSGFKGPTFGPAFRSKAYAATNALRPGDIVAMTVYEAGGSTLFPPPVATPNYQSVSVGSGQSQNHVQAGASTVPAQIVESDGTINVPFVGRVKVTGQTPGQVGRKIEQELRGKAVEPQVIVSLVSNTTNTATVGGDVNTPKPVSLSLRGERLLDVVAAAGGSKFPAYETYVEVVRGDATGRALLQTVVKNAADNIVIRPNDQIFLMRNARSFAVMGATQKVAQYPFDTERVTLAEAIARAGGPIDTVGDPAGIYLFRFEPWPIARQALSIEGIDLSQSGPTPDFVPILYKIGLNSADGYFYAQSIQMRDKDVVLISNAEATQMTKMLMLTRGFTGVGADIARIAHP